MAWVGDAQGRFTDNVAKLLNDANYHDYTIVCGEHRWGVNKLVISAQSSVLAAACKGVFKEALECSIDLSEEHPACVDGMIRFFYTMDFPSYESVFGPQLSTLVYYVRIAILADKYDIGSLHYLATKKFSAEAPGKLTTPEFAEAASLAFSVEGPTKEIRDNVVFLAVDRGLVSPKDESNPAFRQLVASSTELMLAIIENAVPRLKEESLKYKICIGDKDVKCPECDMMFTPTSVEDGEIECERCDNRDSPEYWVYYIQ